MNLALFKYQAFDNQGEIQAGQVNAESEREAIRILKGKNLTPIKIKESKKNPRILKEIYDRTFRSLK